MTRRFSFLRSLLILFLMRSVSSFQKNIFRRATTTNTKLASIESRELRFYRVDQGGRPLPEVYSEPTLSEKDPRIHPEKFGIHASIQLSDDEKELFHLLRKAREETNIHTTLRVAGGWVRDKLLATPEFQAYHKVFDVGTGKRLTSKFQRQKPAPSMGRQGTKVLVSSKNDQEAQPVDIDIALDDMLGREFADHLNEYLGISGQKTISVGVVLKNPEKSKHLETATMKVGSFWIDFVNLRAEEYTQDSRIPDLMRIGTPEEDALRRDLTINALFYNINTGQVEDWTGRGIDDLRKGIVATPLPPLTTLLDDPLRVLRSVRFAARLRFNMDEDLVKAAREDSVRHALDQKVSRERVGGEVDLMLRSPDPVGAMRLLINLQLAETVFPLHKYLGKRKLALKLLDSGLDLLSATHDHLADCRVTPPVWCTGDRTTYGVDEVKLIQNEEARRLLWYAAFLKPTWDRICVDKTKDLTSGARSKKANRSCIVKLLVDDLKRPTRDAETIEKILGASDDISRLMETGGDVTATMILLSEIRVQYSENVEGNFMCSMNGRSVDPGKEDDPVWLHAMEFRRTSASILERIGSYWRASLFLSLAEQLWSLDSNGEMDYVIEGDVLDESQSERREGVIESFDILATAFQQLGLIGIWNEKPLLDGGVVKKLLPKIPRGPAFKEVMECQTDWMIRHPGADESLLRTYLRRMFPDYV